MFLLQTVLKVSVLLLRFVLLICFVIAEAKAAQSAKLEAILVTREGNEELDDDAKKQFKTIATFSEITFEISGKRKNEDEPETTEVCC